jgi:F-type H+-transporting ATPase subunit b
MPQLDIATFASQLFWLYVSFGLLIVLLSIFALPKIGGVLEERQKRIDGNLDKATQWKAEAEAAIVATEIALAESRAEAQRILLAAAASIALQAEARQKALADRLAQQISEAEARIGAAKQQAMNDILALSSDLVRATLQKLTGQSVDDAQIAAAFASGQQS